MSKQEVSPIRLLIVDDSEEDVMILARQLSRKGLLFDFSHIEYLEDLQNELERQPWDIVLTDHKMVGFSSSMGRAAKNRDSPSVGRMEELKPLALNFLVNHVRFRLISA